MWIPVRIAVQPISQTRCQPDANTERKRGNRYMLGRVTPHSPPSGSPPIMRDIKRESSPRNKKKHGRKNYMKRKLQIITSASTASLLAFSALAQETLNPQ